VVLGPVLFWLLFINDVSSTCHGQAQLKLFSDDVQLYSSFNANAVNCGVLPAVSRSSFIVSQVLPIKNQYKQMYSVISIHHKFKSFTLRNNFYIAKTLSPVKTILLSFSLPFMRTWRNDIIADFTGLFNTIAWRALYINVNIISTIICGLYMKSDYLFNYLSRKYFLPSENVSTR